MRILYLVGGDEMIAGGATVRDAALVQGLSEAGHEVLAVSLYGPTRVEGERFTSSIFQPLGHTTLRRLFPRLAQVPSALASLIRRPRPVVNMTSLAVMGKRFDARGPLAVSLLSASNAKQRREFHRLMDYLEPNSEPIDIVILANTMLSGLSEAIRGNLNCPIICMSQGSDKFIESLDEPYRSDARKLVRKNAKLFRMVVATSRYFAIRATESLALPASRIRVVPPGIDVEQFDPAGPRVREPFTVGYFAPIHKDRGLDILVDAVESLARDNAIDPRLWIAGPVVDERYWHRLLRRLEAQCLKDRHVIWGNIHDRKKCEFMSGLSAFVVSSREPESRPTHVLEAMACGVPVVGPASGIMPEIFQHVNGGLLVSSDAPSWMFAQALELLASMPDTADEMGQAGAEGVRNHFSVHSSAAKLVDTIADVIGDKRPRLLVGAEA